MKLARRMVSLSARTLKRALLLLLPLALTSCGRNPFPSYPANYHEFAYVSNGASNTFNSQQSTSQDNYNRAAEWSLAAWRGWQCRAGEFLNFRSSPPPTRT